MNLEKNAPYLAMALIAITLIFSQIGIFDEKYNLDLNLLIQESENDAFLELNEYSLSKIPRLPSGSDHMTYFAKASLSNSGEKKFISNKIKAIFKK